MTRASSRRPGPPTRTERGIPEATVARLPVYLRALTALSDCNGGEGDERKETGSRNK